MYTGHCYGYGLDDEQLRMISKENLVAFLLKNFDELKEHMECDLRDCNFDKLTSDEILERFSSYDGDYGSGIGSGILGAMRDIMQAKMKITLHYADCEDGQAIYMPQMMPWDMNENDSKIRSEEDLQTLFQPFLDELGISEETVGDIDIEWWG